MTEQNETTLFEIWVDEPDNGDGYVVHKKYPKHVQGELHHFIQYSAYKVAIDRIWELEKILCAPANIAVREIVSENELLKWKTDALTAEILRMESGLKVGQEENLDLIERLAYYETGVSKNGRTLKK